MEDIIDIIVTETTNLIEITSQPTDEIIDVNIIDNREDVTLNVTPTVVEININSLTGNFGVNWGEIDGTLSNQTDLQNALNLKADLVGGKVPSSQLPSYVDDVVEVANYAALPTTGETGKIYVTIDTNYIYRWTGSTYVEIKDSSAVWGAITGTLSNQTDLQNALNTKLSTSTAASTYVPYTGATGNVNLGLDYSLTAALIIKSGGTSTQFLKADGSIDTNTYATTSQLHNPVTLGTANGLSLSTQVLSLGLASSSANGALSSTDWTTFNGKQAALNGAGFVKISGTTISYDNSTYLTTSAAASTYVSGSGTTNYLPRWSSSKVLTDSFVYTNGNYTEIQGQGLTASMGIIVSGRYGSVANAPKIYSSDETTGVAHIELVNGGGEIRIGVEKSTGGQILPGSSAYATVLTAGLSGRNLEFGTNNTKRLTIDGSTGAATFTSSVTASSHIVPGGTSLQFQKGDGSLDSNTYLTTSSASSTYLAKTGGTLTGALSGTSATFSGEIQTTQGIYINRASLPYIQFAQSGTAFGQIRGNGTTFGLTDANGTTYYLGLNAFTGAATFSSSVTAGGDIQSNGIYRDYQGEALIQTTTGAITQIGSGGATTSRTIAFLAGNSERMRITSSGNVGIGTTAPTDFTIYGYGANIEASGGRGGGFVSSSSSSTYKMVMSVDSSGGVGMLKTLTNHPLMFATNDTERMRITSGGNVGIGTTSPTSLLDVKSSTPAISINSTNTSNASTLLFKYSDSYVAEINAVAGSGQMNFNVGPSAGWGGYMSFKTDTSERMRITSGGDLIFIGQSSSKIQFYNAYSGSPANVGLALFNTSGTTVMGLNANGGGIYTASLGTGLVYSNAGNLTSTNPSDSRLKKNIKTISYGLSDIMKLRPVSYDWKEDNINQGIQFGFIAQEVQEVMPDAIKEFGEETKFLGLEKDAIYATLVNAVKELKAELDTLKNK